MMIFGGQSAIAQALRDSDERKSSHLKRKRCEIDLGSCDRDVVGFIKEYIGKNEVVRSFFVCEKHGTDLERDGFTFIR